MSSVNSSSPANLVITILSKRDRTQEDWESLASTKVVSHGLQIHLPGKILDTSAQQRSSDSANEVAEGKLYEVYAVFQSEGSQDVSIEQCKTLRNSESFQRLQDQEDVEVVLQPHHIYLEHRTPGLAVFDMDSTLIQQEVIDELARAVGRYDEVAAVTEAAMRGELDFEESLRARVSKLKGVDANIWEKLKQEIIVITPGARVLAKALKGLGWKTAVLSGGFTPLATWLRDEIGLDYAFANHLALDESKTLLSGELVGGTRIIDGTAKRELLVQIAEDNQIPLQNTIAVGDGSNDLPMMQTAGFGIAYNAKPKVQAAAPARLNSSSLVDILYLLGFQKLEIAKAANVELSILDS